MKLSILAVILAVSAVPARAIEYRSGISAVDMALKRDLTDGVFTVPIYNSASITASSVTINSGDLLLKNNRNINWVDSGGTTRNAVWWDGSDLLNFQSGSHMTFNPGFAEYMRLTSAGKLGIGTAAPESVLNIKQSANTTAGSYTTYPFVITNQSTIGGAMGSDASYLYLDPFGSRKLYLNTVGSNTILNGAGGSVGIGTASPASTATLHVAGGASVTGAFSLAESTTSISGAWTAWTPVSPTGCSGALTNTSSRYLRIGKTLILNIDVECTSNATGWEITLPFSPTAVNNMVPCAVRDNGVFVAGLGLVIANSSPTMTVYKDGTLTSAWTNSGTKRVICSGSVEIQ